MTLPALGRDGRPPQESSAENLGLPGDVSC
jgi:hypothetical protein